MKFFFIIPVFNDEKSLVKLIEEIKNILDKDSNELNFIIVNDASDEKLNNLSNISNAHFINLKSNQGNQKSIYVGLNYLNELNVNYDYLIVMDSDGEDNPKDIFKLIDKCKENNDKKIIFASRLRRNEGLIFKFSYFCYKLIFLILTGKKLNFGNFSCIPKQYVKNIVNLPTISFHYSASILKSKIPYLSEPCDKGKRYDGDSKMKLNSLLLHALKSLSIYYEEILIRFLVLSTAGILIGLFSIILIFFNKFFATFVLIGWSSNMVIGLTIITIIFLFMFFSCLLILLNKNIYRENTENFKNYKFLIGTIENANHD